MICVPSSRKCLVKYVLDSCMKSLYLMLHPYSFSENKAIWSWK